MTMAPFVVPISELLRPRAAAKPVQIEAVVDWSLDLSRVSPRETLRASLVLDPVQGGILVEGTLDADVDHTCHRCLATWTEHPSVPVAELFVDEGDDDSDYVVEGVELDLEPLLRDELLLSLPLVPTCPDGCVEVVAATQSDLNTSTPDDDGVAASPFAVLKDLLDAGE